MPLCMLSQIGSMPRHQSIRHHDNIHGKNLTTGYSSLVGYRKNSDISPTFEMGLAPCVALVRLGLA